MPIQRKQNLGNAERAPEQPARGAEVEISKFWANRRGDAIIVKLVEFGGKWFIDARRHYTDRSGRFAPTAKGTMLCIRKLPELLKAIEKAEREARARNLIDNDGDGGDERATASVLRTSAQALLSSLNTKGTATAPASAGSTAASSPKSSSIPARSIRRCRRTLKPRRYSFRFSCSMALPLMLSGIPSPVR